MVDNEVESSEEEEKTGMGHSQKKILLETSQKYFLYPLLGFPQTSLKKSLEWESLKVLSLFSGFVLLFISLHLLFPRSFK